MNILSQDEKIIINSDQFAIVVEGNSNLNYRVYGRVVAIPANLVGPYDDSYFILGEYKDIETATGIVRYIFAGLGNQNRIVFEMPKV